MFLARSDDPCVGDTSGRMVHVGKRAWWLIAVAILVVVPAAILANLVAHIDLNRIKVPLIAAVQASTGRMLELRGDIRLSQVLPPVIEVDEVFLANLQGGSRPDMARAERVAVTLSLPALLQRRIEITQLTLTGPNILFEEVNGKANWRLDLPAAADAAQASGSTFGLAIRNAVVRNGMVTWHLPARTKVLGIRNMEVRHHSDGGPVEFGGTFVYADNQPFRLTGSALPTAGLADPWTTRLDLSAFDTAASASGTMDTAGIYDMQVEATIGSLEKLNALLPEMRLPSVHKAALSTQLTNGRRPGDLPVIGATRLRFADADMGTWLPGLKLRAFDVSVDKPAGTAVIEGSGQYRNQVFDAKGTIGVPLHPDEAVSVPVDMALKAGPRNGQASGNLGLNGRLALQALAFHGFNGAIALSTPALAALRPVSTPGLPGLTGVQLSSRVVLPADASSISFSAARLSSNQGDLAGEGSLGLGGAPRVTARLQSGALDLGAMTTAFGLDPAPPRLQHQPGGPSIPDTPLAWNVLRGPTLDVTASVGALTFMDETWRDVQLDLDLKNGLLERGALAVISEGSPVSVSVTADARQDAVPVTLAIDAPALPLALVARYAGLPGPVAGSARVHARLQARGASLHRLAASLNGSVSLASVGGQISNAAFIQLTSASLSALGIKVPPQGATALHCLGVAAAFRNGLGRVTPIALETTYLSMDGEGEVDLQRETVSLALKPLATVSGSPVAVPVVVSGPFSNISGRLDATGLDKLGLLIDAWFGGDRSTACADAGLVQAPRP